MKVGWIFLEHSNVSRKRVRVGTETQNKEMDSHGSVWMECVKGKLLRHIER